MMPETVVCFRWTPIPGYRSTFGPESVNTLRAMVARHYQRPHRFVCFTDNTHGLDPRIEALPIWTDYADVPSPHGGNNPSCYRRLRLFSHDIAATVGQRFVAIDLDCVVVKDLTPLWDRPEDFVIWGDTNPKTAYNGSLVLMTAGSRRQVWDTFDPKRSPKLSMQAGCFGSDQGWISYCLGPHEKKWSQADGVYSFRNDLRKQSTLPANARIVFFHGSSDPWSQGIPERYPWVRDHWTLAAETAVTA